MLGKLNDLNVLVPPAYSCNEFEVSGAVILECQDFVACGCPGVTPDDAMEALYFASLADHNALLELRAALLRLEEDGADDAADSSSMAGDKH